MDELPRYRGFTIEVGRSDSQAMPWQAWARAESDDAQRRLPGSSITALGQWEQDALTNAMIEIDKFWDS
jgi:hypothetical protein